MVNPFRMFFPKKMVGIDIGTSSIKVVEISRWGQGKTLENYGEVKSDAFYKESLLDSQKGSYLISNNSASRIIKAILEDTKIRTKAAIFSIPDFSTFCTSFELPPMTEKEIPDAIHYNASQYITLPISEVTLDWHILANPPEAKNAPLKVFLVAVPNQVVQEYQQMARLTGLQLYALEAEVLGITRALVKDKKKSICLVDIGMQSTTINIVDKGFLKKSYSFNFNSGQLSRAVSTTLGVAQEQAENIKNTEGLMHHRQDLVKDLYLLIGPLLVEVKSICEEFSQSNQRPVDQILLTGGTSNLPGLKEYFAESLKVEVLVPNCFSDFLYPPILEDSLRQMAPSFSVAVGVALGGLGT